ncbi:MAG: orotidine-5'-phosphate decarboxylase [Gammaproteobacteria bacterium]|nr:orotidine-5'-phosphate decarboxylase [Gammaproteobacteria bacterium]
MPDHGPYVNNKDISLKDRLIFAMDVSDCDRARELADELGDAVTFYKIGLELMMTGGYFELLDWMLERDKKVFADLKFFDIPATVGSAVRQLKDRGASFVTVHGNQSIMEAAAENKGDNLKVLAVTVLTSLDRGDLDDLGFDCDVGELVLSRAKRALESGCDGVISSGLEAPKLREFIDQKLLVITPGIRPVDNKPTGDQKRVVSVEQAFKNGADHIVIGRPIRDAASPREAAEAAQATIASQFE